MKFLGAFVSAFILMVFYVVVGMLGGDDEEDT